MTDAEIFKLAVEVSNEEPELCARLAVEFQRVKESAYNAGLSAGIVAGADAEREACANVAARIGDKYAFGFYGNEVDTADEIAAAIRERMK